jgi:type IV pilus assembly protein PilC
MAYFKWVGIDLVGNIKKGKAVAYSSADMENKLLHQGIALLHCKTVYTPSLLWPVTSQLKGNLFQHKAKLLKAGLLLPQVLEIAGQQSHNPIIHDMLFTMSRDIQNGIPFDKALEKHDALSDPIVKVMLIAGYESGNILNAVENVAIYFNKQHIFAKGIRSALAMPLVTLLFFVGISLFIFICIIPRFADMFSSLQQELPALTQYMIRVSAFLCSVSALYAVGGIAIIGWLLYRYCATFGKSTWDKIIMHIPFIGAVMWQHHMGQALQALSLLVSSGVTLVTALAVVERAVDHSLVKNQLQLLHDDVASGQLLSSAMHKSTLFLPEVVAFVFVGQESGTLGQALDSAATVYNDALQQQLKLFIFLLQPIAIIVLGLLVTTLIFAVYLPIIQMSHIV